MNYPDITDWYENGMIAVEEAAWEAQRRYEHNARLVTKTMHDHHLTSVLEVGCASGRLCSCLPTELHYLGVDKSPTFLALARGHCPDRRFIQEDVRNLSEAWLLERLFAPQAVCFFAFIKHFGLHEKDDLLIRLMKLAPYAIFDVNVSTRDLDNGVEFHHTSITEERLLQAVHSAGRGVCSKLLFYDGVQAANEPLKEYYLVTGPLA